MALYEIWLTADTGSRIALLDNVVQLEMTRVVNGIGSTRLEIPASFDTSLIVPDRMLQIWRAPTGGNLALWRPYFLRFWRYETRGAEETIIIGGPDCNDLLRRRIVAYAAGESESTKTADFADDIMREVVDENMVSATDTDRNWSALSVAAELSAGPSLTRSFAWKNVLKVLQDLNKASRAAGTEVFFDVIVSSVTGSSISSQFRTATGQPGQDVRDRVIFDQERGNLAAPFLEYDYQKELNYVYGLGQGVEDVREQQTASDTARIDISQFGRMEGYADARNQDAANGVREKARALLAVGEPIRRFGSVPLDTEGTRFGRDWNFGDRIRTRYRGQEFDAIVRAVQISLNDSGAETIRARLEYED
jgi:hypothetical protein